MFIEQIIFNNFRVYYGNNPVVLAGDKNRHISIVAGNNGFGKTSFLTGLVWGLYGKLIVDVDLRYRQEISESGGYRRYCEKLMNKLAISSTTEQISTKVFSVTLSFTKLLIPSVPCEQVQIKRSYNIETGQEDVEILIDGITNELTKSVGPEIFINDFILPKEIAKFFFFDAEKIVSLSDIKTADEKKFLSQAYAEVLGIKKYTDLKVNLENVRMRLRNKSASKSDRDKLSKLQSQLVQNEKLLVLNQDEISEKSDLLAQKRMVSDRYQEQLIREGSGMTIDQFKALRESQQDLVGKLSKTKTLFNDLLELAPFAIAAANVLKVKKQLETELTQSAMSQTLLTQKFGMIKSLLESQSEALEIPAGKKGALLQLIERTLMPDSNINHKALLDFSSDQQNRFLSIYDNLINSFSKYFKQLIADQKRIQSNYNLVNRKLQDAESKEKDTVVSAIRQKKLQADAEIIQLENDIDRLQARISGLNTDNQSLLRQTSELSKHVRLEDADHKKDLVAERTINNLDRFILKLKLQKKTSLENNIHTELNRLMHKSNFVGSVNVSIQGDLIDIDLFDQHNQLIEKDMLSKGEQQLYATALLTALIQESNIHFPVFIDSPLQKFDKQHSKNIIKEFYPHIADQVVLFPLLQKELNEEEYQWLLPQVGRAYLIEQNVKYQSKFTEVNPNELFLHLNQTLNHV
ncbi:DNA sulfur modification protein DndD [Pedobacter psychrodurus]|uniref:DNA sulfur modification protein DndD n=1 Tax=Pedobacter psychrodurus TaxID=2530456 RepID=A0A4R0PZF8_9SPHI|nr:AAA family ATPase [Pedobacter psychrodurus]TCD28640.1 DNA sulfur modification protein DndD [Pedobacter psychrodurus]